MPIAGIERIKTRLRRRREYIPPKIQKKKFQNAIYSLHNQKSDLSNDGMWTLAIPFPARDIYRLRIFSLTSKDMWFENGLTRSQSTQL
jgi:hypothetical protein